jgi:hypothetical protein
MSYDNRRAGRAIVVGAALLLCAAPARAQLITGRVVDDGTQSGVNAATIQLVDSLGTQRASGVSDSTGGFRIMAPMGGRYRLRVEHIGYAPLETAAVEAKIGMQMRLELRLSATAVALEPLRVIGQSAFNAGWLQEYYDRASWTRRAGTGRVFFRDEVERERMSLTSGFLIYLMPRSNCRPAIYVDGLQVEDARQLDSALQPRLIEGVELYNNVPFFPFRYQNRGHCALALFWTQRDVERRGPLNWPRLLAGAGILGLMALLAQL